VVVLAACSSRAPAPKRPVADDPTGSGSATGSAATPVTAKVSEADCLAMFDHMIAIDIKDRPADQQLSADQTAQVRAELRDTMLGECLQLPPDQVACVMAATTKAAVHACDGD